MTIRRAATAFFCHIALALALLAAIPGPSRALEDWVPLALVGEDTVTTRDLEVQLNIMRQRMPEDAELPLPPAEDVLRRLIQNQLVVQEGFRMGLQDRLTVRNQLIEARRTRASEALLDSIADTAPTEVDDPREARRETVKAYIDDLMEFYGVEVDSSLLRSLDYATNDEAALEALGDDERVLTVVPSGPVKVKNLSRSIRFREYHGLANKPDAPERRDRIFYELVVESLVRYEARRLGFENRHEIDRLILSLERQLVLEEALNVLLVIDFDPGEEEVQAFYQEHLAEFTPELKIRLETVKLESEEAAIKFRERLQQGAKMNWLVKNSPGVVPGPPPFPSQFLPPSVLGLDDSVAAEGTVLEPLQGRSGWIVGVVAGVQPAEPIPLEQCRPQVLGMMKNERTQAHAADIMSRLEDATEIRILPEAEKIVADKLAATLASD